MGILLHKSQSVSLAKEAPHGLSRITLGVGWDVAKKGVLGGLFGGSGDIASDSGPHTGLILARLARADGAWNFKAIGERTGGRTVHDLTAPARTIL